MQVNLVEGESLTICVRRENGWVQQVNKFEVQGGKLKKRDIMLNLDKKGDSDGE